MANIRSFPEHNVRIERAEEHVGAQRDNWVIHRYFLFSLVYM
jgi:hypothetical protein